jgi:hypothetical protein
MRGIDYAHFRSVKRFPDPDSGKAVYLLKRKCKKFKFSPENQLYRSFSMRGIDYAHFRSVQRFPNPDSGKAV